MQFWPRKRAKRSYARVRYWLPSKEPIPLGFAGYKVGMTHLMGIDSRKNAFKKDLDVPVPVTVIECPPLRLVSVRFYNQTVSQEIFVGDHKDLKRKLKIPKKIDTKALDKVNLEEVENVVLVVHTLPSKTGIGKKKPEVFELHLGGTKEEKLTFAKAHIGKDIKISDVFKEGDLVDTHALTKGKGTQGPVRRMGIGLKASKSEKGRRTPGSLGGWKGQQHFMYRVAMAGQTGYQQRTQFNLQIYKISSDPKEINVKGGYKHYGDVKNEYVLVRGSVQGTAKRLIIFTRATRPQKKHPLPEIHYISTESKQGR